MVGFAAVCMLWDCYGLMLVWIMIILLVLVLFYFEIVFGGSYE